MELWPFQPAVHAELLGDWLARPHVATAWGDAAKNMQQILSLQPPAGCAFIAHMNAPVGFIQWEPIAKSDLQLCGITVPDEHSVDIDIFIADEKQLGQGLGSRAIVMLMHRFAEEGVFRRATLFTSESNTRAQKAYQKAGFRLASRFREGSVQMLVLLAEV